MEKDLDVWYIIAAVFVCAVSLATLGVIRHELLLRHQSLVALKWISVAVGSIVTGWFASELDDSRWFVFGSWIVIAGVIIFEPSPIYRSRSILTRRSKDDSDRPSS